MAVILTVSIKSLQRSGWLLSFFDDDEETAPRPSPRAPRRPTSAAGGPRRPSPRRPQRSGTAAADQHTLLVRRGMAAGVGLVVLILIVLLISSLVKSGKRQALETYNREVSTLAQESDKTVSEPLFKALTGASGKSAQDVEQEVNEQRGQAQTLAARAKALSVPGEMAGAQQNLLLTLDLRVEGMDKLTELLPAALGGQSKQLAAKLAGDMEIFLASDVVYSQRVAPLIQQTLANNGIAGLSTAQTRFLPNLGWLEAQGLTSRLTGQSSSTGSSSPLAPGTHGSALLGVSVGASALEAEPAVNHLSAGANPTFTVNFEDSGENPETNVKVDVTVTAGGKQYKASNTVSSTQPGTKYNAEVTVHGVPLGAPAKVEAYVLPVPGETNVENNKATYLAVLGE